MSYREIGIRSHCKGIFHKPAVTGRELGTKRVFWVEPNSFVLNIVFAWEQAVAVTSPAEESMICSHRFPMYQPIRDAIDTRYALLYFSTPRGKHQLTLASPGGAGRNKTLNRREFLDLEIPLPPLPVQRRIAEILATWEAAIAQIEKLLEAKQRLKRGFMRELLGGRRGLDGVQLGDVTEVIMGNSPPSSAYNSEGRGLPLLQGNADTLEGRSCPRMWTTIATKECLPGDTLLSVRAPVGEVSVADHRACLGRGMCAIRARDGHAQGYIHHYLAFASRQWLRLQQGSTFGAVNSEDVRRFPIRMPPDRETQHCVASFLDCVDREMTLLRSLAKKRLRQKRALLQQLLTGKVRVKV